MLERKFELMEHQKKAFDKLKGLKVGALYMDMGTGKTRTMIEIIVDKFQRGKNINKVAWFCPVMAKENIKMDILKHCPGLIPYTKIFGIESIAGSDRMYLEMMDYIGKNKCILVVDESHRVKNWMAKTTKRMINLAEICEYKYLLTGTPVTKNEADLFSQWYILDKRIFGYMSYWSFKENHLELNEYGRPIRVLNVDYLTNKIAPYTYKVSKNDIDLNLRGKQYDSFNFLLSATQEMHYDQVLMTLSSHIRNDWELGPLFRLFTGLMLVVSGRRITKMESEEPLESENFFNNPIDNPRIQALLYLLEDMDEKCIIWCNYIFEVEEISKAIENKNLSYRTFTGEIPTKKRNENIESFRNDVQFLVANKACGGVSLNLQFAHNAIYYSNDFDWGNRVQSEDRIHRIGQGNRVFYTDIQSNMGIEKIIMDNLSKKSDLSDYLNSALKDKNTIIKKLGRVDNDTDRIRENPKDKCCKEVS